MRFFCKNRRFETDVSKGFPHYGESKGSVFDGPLRRSGNYSLWLEHVIQPNDPDEELYWLMWYDQNGRPTIPESAVFNKADIQELLRNLGSLIP
jgi:hypothetical protein